MGFSEVPPDPGDHSVAELRHCGGVPALVGGVELQDVLQSHLEGKVGGASARQGSVRQEAL